MYDDIYNKIKNIFEVATDNGVEVLILGAFGCGAFKNDPYIVAKAFKENIESNRYFQTLPTHVQETIKQSGIDIHSEEELRKCAEKLMKK